MIFHIKFPEDTLTKHENKSSITGEIETNS